MINPDDQPPESTPLSLEEEIPPADQEDAEENDEDEEGEGGKEGKKGGGGGKKPGINVKLDEKLLSEEDLSAYDSESFIEKLKMLAMSPMSALIQGASAFDSESDLRRKLFLGEIGLMTHEIEPQDIADPNLIAKLEKRNQERQEMIRAEKAIVLNAAASVVAVAGGLAALPDIPDPVPKIERPKEPSVDARREIEAQTQMKKDAAQEQKYTSDAEYKSQAVPLDYSADTKQKPEGMRVIDLIEMLPDQSFADDYDASSINVGKPIDQMTGIEKLGAIFNVIAQMTQFTQPEQKTDFKFADPAPKVDIGPVGGV